MTESRLGFISADLRTRIQTGLDLGLDLAAMTNVQNIIDAEAAGDPQIVSIEVFDELGRILFHTGERRPDGMIPASWSGALEAGDQATWRADDPEAMVVGARLTSNFGVQVGGVALRYARAFLDWVTEAALQVMVRLGAVIFVAMVVLTALVMTLLLRDTTKSFRRMDAALKGALERAEGPIFVPRRSGIETEFAAMAGSLRQV